MSHSLQSIACVHHIAFHNIKQIYPGGGFSHQNRTWMCLPDLENLTISIPIFCQNFPPISIPFSEKKHPIWIKLGAFYNNLPKIHPIYVIWAPSSLMENPPIAIPNFAKRCPKRQAHIRIPCQCENPPRADIFTCKNNTLLQIKGLIGYRNIVTSIWNSNIYYTFNIL